MMPNDNQAPLRGFNMFPEFNVFFTYNDGFIGQFQRKYLREGATDDEVSGRQPLEGIFTVDANASIPL